METVQRPYGDQDHPTETTNVIVASDVIETNHPNDDNTNDAYVLKNQEKEQCVLFNCVCNLMGIYYQ